ncbi:MAG: hypothetical protein ACLR8P_00845 [Clostridium fessum]
MIAAADMAGRDSLELIVNGHGEQTMATALFDNLGKWCFRRSRSEHEPDACDLRRQLDWHYRGVER